MFGKINFENFEEEKLPQKAASAFSVLDNLVGCTYKCIKYLGSQQVHGTIYYFIAEMTLVLATPQKHIVLVAIHEQDGDFKFEPNSVQVIL